MANYAISDGTTIVNVIVADTQDVAEAVTGMTAIESSGVPWLGWTLVNGEWTAPPEPQPAANKLTFVDDEG